MTITPLIIVRFGKFKNWHTQDSYSDPESVVMTSRARHTRDDVTPERWHQHENYINLQSLVRELPLTHGQDVPPLNLKHIIIMYSRFYLILAVSQSQGRKSRQSSDVGARTGAWRHLIGRWAWLTAAMSTRSQKRSGGTCLCTPLHSVTLQWADPSLKPQQVKQVCQQTLLDSL